jgi:hypothetical protein
LYLKFLDECAAEKHRNFKSTTLAAGPLDAVIFAVKLHAAKVYDQQVIGHHLVIESLDRIVA